MVNRRTIFWIFIFFGMINFWGGVFAAYYDIRRTFEAEAVDRGYARYHPETGKWEWKDVPKGTIQD